MKLSTISMMATLVAMVCTANAEVSPSRVPTTGASGWKFEITPYAWFMGIDGDVTVGGQETEFDRSASDVLDAMDIGGSLLLVAQYDRYLVWGQADYLSVDSDNLDVEDRPQGGRLESECILGEAAVGYQIDGWAEGQTFDLLVGVRTLHIENDLSVTGVGSGSSDNDLVDPIIVVRPSIPILPSKVDGLRFNPTLAIGGGGDSDLVYELQPQIQYQITENVAARVGYRNVGYRFKGDDAENPVVQSRVADDDELNINFSGMIIGLGVTF